ncbi:MAG: alpha/beta hydrolase [Fimbriimonadaceae bacterium]
MNALVALVALAAGYASHTEIAYVEDGHERQKLDIHAATGAEKAPVVVMIHGGGWRIGDKANRNIVEPRATHFTENGYVYVTINYRLSPEVQHPAHVKDVARALAWVHDNIDDYGGDSAEIFLMGHSAGAHLAALVSADETRLEAEGKDLSIIKGVVLLDSAAYNLPRYAEELGAGPNVISLYENAFGEDRSSWSDASPTLHIEQGKNIPPMLIFHTGRRMAGDVLSNELAEKLREAGTTAAAIHAKDKDHAGINRCIGEPGDLYTDLVMEFLASTENATALRL